MKMPTYAVSRLRKRWSRFPLILAFVLLFCTSATLAQPTVRNLSGVITDQHREPLKGAIVQIQNQNTNGVVSYITDRNGQYTFLRLSGDTDYRVWATWRNHQSKIKKLSLFDSKTAKIINFRINSF